MKFIAGMLIMIMLLTFSNALVFNSRQELLQLIYKGRHES